MKTEGRRPKTEGRSKGEIRKRGAGPSLALGRLGGVWLPGESCDATVRRLTGF